jgi:hypothetical protein
VYLIVLAIILIFVIVLYWRIWSKAGFSGAWALLMLIPLVNFGSIIYLAFAEWPVRKKLKALQGGGS